MTLSTLTNIICIVVMPFLAFEYYRMGLRRGKREGYKEREEDVDFWKKNGDFWQEKAGWYEKKYDDTKRELESLKKETSKEFAKGQAVGEVNGYANGFDEGWDRGGREGGQVPPVAIGDEVYAVYIPMPQDDDVAEIEAYRVYGVGVTKDGKPFIMNEEMEYFMLDDEDEGLSFSTRERAEEYLKKVQKT